MIGTIGAEYLIAVLVIAECMAQTMVAQVMATMGGFVLLHQAFDFRVALGRIHDNGQVDFTTAPEMVAWIAEDFDEVAWLETDLFGATAMEDIPAAPVVIFIGAEGVMGGLIPLSHLTIPPGAGMVPEEDGAEDHRRHCHAHRLGAIAVVPDAVHAVKDDQQEEDPPEVQKECDQNAAKNRAEGHIACFSAVQVGRCVPIFATPALTAPQ